MECQGVLRARGVQGARGSQEPTGQGAPGGQGIRMKRQTTDSKPCILNTKIQSPGLSPQTQG
eukprot:CAMPEP_0184322620 /NCGR_PEP_ID=MMETSP1049-20130417/125588_1 /TAXON_ID=77928 /ORGANISM="Proteomonas sulcata, Strain CCMP704" /LENGTH=61 /DNA_ID=CAMNT_0026643815 /DNA_START=331 /DNA_END=516 /DNA_ORIENTATION=-